MVDSGTSGASTTDVAKRDLISKEAKINFAL